MANYAHIENNTITGVYDTIPVNWRNISNFYVLAENFDNVYTLGWRIVQKETEPTINRDTQYYGELLHTIVDGTVVETRQVHNIVIPETIVVEMSEEDQYNAKVERHTNTMIELRNRRNQLLADTDYTQLNDIITKNGVELTQQFVDYRQLLRDLPSLYENNLDFNDINTVEYPTMPGV
jgi:hypothetical protein